MFTKIAIALAIMISTASGALAEIKKNTSVPNFDAGNCRGAYLGSDPRTLINRPQNRMCDRAE
jgi:hypothetical protein